MYVHVINLLCDKQRCITYGEDNKNHTTTTTRLPKKVLSTTLVRDHQFMVISIELYVRHIGPPSLGTRFPRLIKKLSQLLKGRGVEDALPGEEGGAVELECRECDKWWLRRAGGWEQCG